MSLDDLNEEGGVIERGVKKRRKRKKESLLKKEKGKRKKDSVRSGMKERALVSSVCFPKRTDLTSLDLLDE